MQYETERLAVRGKVMGENIVVIKTSVVPLVGAVCSIEQKNCRVIDSWRGVVPHCARVVEEELEEPSLVLRFGRTGDGEIGAQEQIKPLLLDIREAKGRRGEGDVWFCKQIWKHKDKDDHKKVCGQREKQTDPLYH